MNRPRDPWTDLAAQAGPLYADDPPAPPGLVRSVLARVRPASPIRPDPWRWCAAAAGLAAAAVILAALALPVADAWQIIAVEPLP
jgi:hypothetical protein